MYYSELPLIWTPIFPLNRILWLVPKVAGFEICIKLFSHPDPFCSKLNPECYYKKVDNSTYPVLLPNACELGLLLLLLLVPPALGQVDGQGLPLHLRQQALLHQWGLLEARVAVHLHQLIYLSDTQGEGGFLKRKIKESELTRDITALQFRMLDWNFWCGNARLELHQM